MILDLLNRIFKKKIENHWYYFNIETTYDLHNHPDVSRNSPIRYYKSTYNFKYCPITKEIWYKLSVQSKYYERTIPTLILTFGEKVQREIDIIEKRHKRKQSINSLLY